jgi:multidrug efflux pump
VSQFFIDRPIFAWVLAIGTMLVGMLALRALPISRYPEISPPTVRVSATYPGASAEAVEDSVTQVIEQSMTGLDGLRYMAATSSSRGASAVTLTFETGTDPDLAQIQVQNKLQQVTSLLPQTVQNQGVTVTKTGDEILMVVALVSEDGSQTASDLGDFIASNMQTPMSRVLGVGSVTLFGAQYAMRIWLDPTKLQEYSLVPSDIVSAVQAQNTQVSVGQLGAQPTVEGQQINATITAQSQMQTAEQFRNILLRTSAQGATVHLSDVATVQLGSASYDFLARYNGSPAAGMAIYLTAGANATDTAERVRAAIKTLSTSFPTGVRAEVAYDTTPFIEASIKEVVKTLIEAIVLVFIVMFVFLQNWRATLIPTLAVPVVLLGTFALLQAFGYSINTLTMFGLVLAIGLLVDDAIVVVENVERLMAEKHLPAREATSQSMHEITGALVGVGIVLAAVFLPMAFFPGTTGVIYRQFSITIVSAMALSVLTAIVFTPALCATLLKQHTGEVTTTTRLFKRFNAAIDRATAGYVKIVRNSLGRVPRMLVIYGAIALAMTLLYLRLPTSFVPEEDQGVLLVRVQTPAGATQDRTVTVLEQVEQYFLKNERDNVASAFVVAGFGLSASGQNSGMAFVRLKHWDDRPGSQRTARAIQQRAQATLGAIRNATVYVVAPPSIPGLGSTSGFSMELQDSAGQGTEALLASADRIVQAAGSESAVQGVRINAPDTTPEYIIDVDHARAGAYGVAVSDLNSVLSIAWGGLYVNDFIDRGRVKRVYVQAAADYRMQPDDLDRWNVRNADGGMVSFASFTSGRWTSTPPQLSRFNGVSSIELQGDASPGTSSGTAMSQMESLARSSASGFDVAWSGLSYEERIAGANAAPLYALSLIVVFLCLAALYESWAVPVAVLLVAPLGVVGVVLATTLRSLENDVYFQVGLLTIVGLAAKNAILIVEFAKTAVDRGEDIVAATAEAARLRLRPIAMTSLAFGLGVLPLAVGTGPGSGSQHAVGTGVLGGMLGATILGVLFVPVLYVTVQRLVLRRREPKA